jgi:uncharacterized membrane protein HdeD (DUF308 family)
LNRFVRGAGYAKVRLVSGTLFIALGLVLIVRTATTIGLAATAIVPLVLGFAMIGLGVVRWREYLRQRSGAQ